MLNDREDGARWPLRRLGTFSTAPAPVTHAAVGGAMLVLTTESAVHVGPATPGARFRELMRLDWAPDGLLVSPSGRYGMLRSSHGDRVTVVDLQTGESPMSVGEAGGRPGSVVAAFAGTADDEVLVLSRTRHVLEVLTLPAGERLGYAEYVAGVAFIFDSLHPVIDPDLVVAIGHGEGETKDSLLTVSLTELIHTPEAAAAEFTRRSRPNDYAYRLAAGPCGQESIVAYRDPEDDEEPDGDEEDQLAVSDTENLRGFYIRRLDDGRLLERIPYESPVESGTPIFATDTFVVVSAPGRISFVPRAAARRTAPMELNAPVHALDPVSRRVVVVGPDGMVELFQAVDASG